MTTLFQSPLFEHLGKIAKETPLYSETFGGAEVEIAGESPYLSSYEAGIQFPLTKKHKIDAIHLFNGTFEGFCRYQGPFPADLDFTATRERVRAKLGQPSMTAEAGGVGIMAIEFAFDRFEDDQFYVRYQYEAEGGDVRLITLGIA
jgi:hypothetical protein